MRRGGAVKSTGGLLTDECAEMREARARRESAQLRELVPRFTEGGTEANLRELVLAQFREPRDDYFSIISGLFPPASEHDYFSGLTFHGPGQPCV